MLIWIALCSHREAFFLKMIVAGVTTIRVGSRVLITILLTQDSEDASLPEITDLSVAVMELLYTCSLFFGSRIGQVNATVKLHVSGALEGQYTTS